MNQNNLDPSKIFKVGTSFMESKILLTAVKLDLFSKIGDKELTWQEIGDMLGMEEVVRTRDFLDSLYALGFLNRRENGGEQLFSNTANTAFFLNEKNPNNLNYILKFNNEHLYSLWDNLELILTTKGAGASIGGREFFSETYSDPEKLKNFSKAMESAQIANFIQLTESFDFSNYNTLFDVGGSTGSLSIQVVLKYPNINAITFDLPAVKPIADENIKKYNVESKVTAAEGDFFSDPFPKVDVITMGNVLHDWNIEKKKFLLKKAFDALLPGGALIIINNMIDNERHKNITALVMSLNMLMACGEGGGYTQQDLTTWLTDTGFSKINFVTLISGVSAGIAIK